MGREAKKRLFSIKRSNQFEKEKSEPKVLLFSDFPWIERSSRVSCELPKATGSL